MMKSVATKKSDDEDNRRIFLKLEDLRKDSSIITLFLEQMKDHLGQQFGEYGYSVATTGHSLELEMPKLEDFILQNGDLITPSSIINNTGRIGTRLATRNERTPSGAENGQSQEMQDLLIRNAQDRWKMSYSRYLIRMETISDYDIRMVKTITNAIHRNVKNYLEPHERYMKAIVEKTPGEILSCIATLLHSTMISHSTTAAGIAALCKQFAIQHQKADESVEVFFEKWKSMAITLKEHKVYHLVDSQAEARDFLGKLNRIRFSKLQEEADRSERANPEKGFPYESADKVRIIASTWRNGNTERSNNNVQKEKTALNVQRGRFARGSHYGENTKKKSGTSREVECHFCKKRGHIQVNCNLYKKAQSEAQNRDLPSNSRTKSSLVNKNYVRSEDRGDNLLGEDFFQDWIENEPKTGLMVSKTTLGPKLDKNHVLIDSQSEISVFSNKNLVFNVRIGKKSQPMKGIGGTTHQPHCKLQAISRSCGAF